jgi:hypothetical protein
MSVSGGEYVRGDGERRGHLVASGGAEPPCALCRCVSLRAVCGSGVCSRATA